MAHSRYPLFLVGFDGLVQPGSSLSHLFIVLLTVVEFPAGVHRHLDAAVCATLTALSAAHVAYVFVFEWCVWGRF